MSRRAIPRCFVIFSVTIMVFVALACAKSEEPAAVPSPGPTAQTSAPSAPATTPAAPPTSGATATPAATAAGTGPRPLVPGGPPFDRATFEKTTFWQIYQKYHQTRLPLWTKASYGGELRSAGSWTPSTWLQLHKVQILNRPSYAGMLLLIDMGLCSMVGREGRFDTCDGKYGLSDQIKIIPGIFERWEQPDPLTYVFYIRKGALWPKVEPMKRTDREVTADDIVWFLDLTKREGALKDNFNLVQTMEAADRYTVRIKMQSPHAEFLRHMANTSMGVFPKECYEEKDCLGAKLISPGPYLLGVSIPREKGSFEKNPEFHLRGLPYMDRITILQITDPQSQKSAFITRQVDVTTSYQALGEPENIAKQTPGARVQAQGILAGTIVLRPQLKGPLADVRVRRALTMALDLPSVWAGVDGFQTFPNLVSRDYFGSSFYMTLQQAGEYYQFNPARAKQMLTEAGFPNGFTTSILSGISSGGNYDMMLAIQDSWKRHLSVDVKINVVDYASYNASLYDSNWPDLMFQYAFNINWWADGEAPLVHMTKGQRLNLQKIDDPKITDLYLKQRGEMDPAKRTALLWEYEQYELSQVYVIRFGITAGLQLTQQWELNGASHQVAYFTGWNGPSWLGMIDASQQPKR